MTDREDDDPAVLKTAQRVLEKAGLKVTTAYGGIEALRRMEEQVPAVVLLDLEMVDLDGPTVLRARLTDRNHRAAAPRDNLSEQSEGETRYEKDTTG